MDWRRGILRLWIVLSILWIGTVSWAERDLWQTQPVITQIESGRATYSILAPDGHTYQIDGPEGASDDEVRAQVLAQHPASAFPPAALSLPPEPSAALAAPPQAPAAAAPAAGMKTIHAKGPDGAAFELNFPVETTAEVIKTAIAKLSREQYLLPVLREVFLPPMALLVFGVAFGWIVRGFRNRPPKST